ncbi:MAG: sigma 54-interacting transcriptional regulator [Victivallales bacterium]
MLILTNEQRKFLGKHIYWDIFSFIFRKARDCKVTINSHFLSRERSPLENNEENGFSLSPLNDDSFHKNIRNWKFMVYNDFSFRHKLKNENIALNEKYPPLFVHLYPYSDNVIEKRNIVLAQVLSNNCIKNGFELLENNFRKLFDKYNANQRFPVEINSSVMLPWKKEIIASSQIKQSHILIHGESGTGKEMTAELINLATFGEEGKKLTKVNCALIDTNLATSLLFGHERGSFTGATNSTPGLIYNARNGALFLDEIHYLPAETLGKLLRFMEDGVITKLGSQNEVRCDVKIIAATNSNEFMKNKKLRELGLIHRFNFLVYIPPVRVRFSEGFEKIFNSMWRKAVSYYEENQRVEIIDNTIHGTEDFAQNEAANSCLPNVEESLEKYMTQKKSTLTHKEISSFHVHYCYKRCFEECYAQAWENSNLRGIYNHILNSITSYAIFHPDFIYKRNLASLPHSSNASMSTINPPGRKSAVDFDELYELMMNFKKQNRNGTELQKEIYTKYAALEKKSSLNNYLQRHKVKHKSDVSIIEKIKNLRNMIRTDGCFSDYPA